MAENKTKPTAVSVESFISQLADETKRADAKALVTLLGEVTGEPPRMWGPSIIGFGTCRYKYESGREGDMPLASFSPRKTAIVIYLLTRDSEPLLQEFGKYTIGKSCLYIKRLADVDEVVLKALVVKSVADIRSRYQSH